MPPCTLVPLFLTSTSSAIHRDSTFFCGLAITRWPKPKHIFDLGDPNPSFKSNGLTHKVVWRFEGSTIHWGLMTGWSVHALFGCGQTYSLLSKSLGDKRRWAYSRLFRMLLVIGFESGLRDLLRLITKDHSTRCRVLTIWLRAPTFVKTPQTQEGSALDFFKRGCLRCWSFGSV